MKEDLLQENRALGWCYVPDYVPAHIKAFILEFRQSQIQHRSMSSAFVRMWDVAAEKRSALAQHATSFVQRLFPTTRNADAELRRRLAAQAEEIRTAEINDPTCTVVYLGADGKHHRDFAAENARRERAQRIVEEIHEIGRNL